MLNSTYKTIAITSFASLFFCGITTQSALAETKAPANIIVADAQADADFKKLDINGDHKISLKEAVKDKTLATSFDTVDANKDGNISPEEYASYKSSKDMSSKDIKGPDSAAVPTAAPAAN
jgi:hypothetical protein